MVEEPKEERGPKTPSQTLEEALVLLKKVQEGIGFSPASSEIIVAALGHDTLSGTSKRKLAALNHFGMLDRTGQGTYRISELGKRILVPRDEQEKQDAIAEAAQRPKFFQKLWEKYEGQALPTLLPNILVREFGVIPESSERVAGVFRDSAEFAGLLRNGILVRSLLGSTPPSSVTHSPVPGPGRSHSTGTELRPADSPPADLLGHQRYSIPLDHAGRVAYFELPLPVHPRDLSAIGSWLEFMGGVAEKKSPGTSDS